MLAVAAVVWFINRQSAAAKTRAGQPARTSPPQGEDENVRRAREEVRRRIAARRIAPDPDPAYRAADPRPSFPALPEPEVSLFETEEDRKVLAAQQKLEDQIQALQKESAAVNRTAPPAVAPSPIRAPESPALAQLKDIPDLRRAVIWREILDKPVGLR